MGLSMKSIILLFLVMSSSFVFASWAETKIPFQKDIKVVQLEKVTSPRRRTSEELHKEFVDAIDEHIILQSRAIAMQLDSSQQDESTENRTKNCRLYFCGCFTKHKIYVKADEK